MSCGLLGPSISGSPYADAVAFLDVHVHAARQQYSLGSPPSSGTMMILRCPLTMPPCLTAVDFRDDGRFHAACAPRTARRRAADRP